MSEVYHLNRNRIFFLRGLGTGIIISAALFYLIVLINPNDKKYLPMTDEKIIERAKELGMDFKLDDESEQVILENNEIEE